ncbi:Transposase IS200-like protein [Umezakia ovalisporum]|uniref:IS200/IS605 family transposase n=1 Tax=Umezakia ovalisporum TaxID=75695 RepID=UPI0006EF108E|nr:IS200/IS605 family transposase [Umezakia ovalisporum]MDH6085128.1 IS200/IS605 family transposase [Umezakia ovalisporum TAC611]CEJ47570.1 Transposase IS200-like protein [Umezakia ovalisporum]
MLKFCITDAQFGKSTVNSQRCQYMYHRGFRSVYRLNAHIILVVKYRKEAINTEILNRLKEIIMDTLKKWDCELLEFNGEPDHVHLLIDYKPDKPLSTLIGNIKTVSSRLIRKEFPWLAKKYFYNKPYFWTGAYFVASSGGVTVEELKNYVENQEQPKSPNSSSP